MNLENAREIAKDIRGFCQTCKEISHAIGNVSNATKSMKKLLDRKNKGSKLITTGVALILSPDPASDIVGAALITAGIVLNKMRECTIADIYGEIRRINVTLKKISREISY